MKKRWRRMDEEEMGKDGWRRDGEGWMKKRWGEMDGEEMDKDG